MGILGLLVTRQRPCTCRCHVCLCACVFIHSLDIDRAPAACRSWGEYGEQTWPPHREAQSLVWVPRRTRSRVAWLGAGRRDCCLKQQQEKQGVTFQYGPEGAAGRCHKGRRWKTAYLAEERQPKQDAWHVLETTRPVMARLRQGGSVGAEA